MPYGLTTNQYPRARVRLAEKTYTTPDAWALVQGITRYVGTDRDKRDQFIVDTKMMRFQMRSRLFPGEVSQRYKFVEALRRGHTEIAVFEVINPLMGESKHVCMLVQMKDHRPAGSF